MRLIGMLDSPYVRRVAISLKSMDLPFTHEPLSVFRDFERFGQVNPVVKAPTLITDAGTVLMDSSLILDYLERLVPSERRLTPADPDSLARVLRVVGLALAACEKTVQTVYEQTLRPPEKWHQPWIERITGQLHAAYQLLEAEVTDDGAWLSMSRPSQADITAAVAWRFTQDALPRSLPAAFCPRLALLSRRAEALPAFLDTPPV